MQNQLKTPKHNTPLISWKTKTISASPKKIKKAEFQIIAGFSLIFSYVAWLASTKIADSIIIIAPTRTVPLTFAAYIILVIVRQKTVYNYTVDHEKGRVDYHLYYPDFASTLFKIIATLAILSFIAAAIYTGSLLFLVGPVAIALGAVRFLLFWKNETHSKNSTL